MYIGIENHEDTYFKDTDFLLNCFYIKNAETLPHWHQYLELILVDQGSCTVQVGHLSYTCQPGDLIVIPSNKLHSMQPSLEGRYYAVVIGELVFKDLMTDPDLKAMVRPLFASTLMTPIHITSTMPLQGPIRQSLMTVIETYGHQQYKGHKAQLKVDLCQLMIHLNQCRRSAPSQEEGLTLNPMIKEVMTYLTRHYDRKISLQDICDKYHLSPQHFCREFKKYTGKTYLNYLTDYRLAKANAFLQTTQLPIAEISQLTGFGNATYFTRVYKKRFGCPPSIARQNLIK